MGVDLSILDLVHVEQIPVGQNTVEVNDVDTIPRRTYYVTTLDLNFVEPKMRPRSGHKGITLLRTL